MEVSAVIAEFGARIGLPDLALGADGVCRIEIDGAITVDLEHDAPEDVLHVYTTVGSLPVDGRAAVMEALLRGNLFGAETGGGSLAYDAATGGVVLCRALPAAILDPAVLERAVEQQAGAAEHWQAKLGDLAAGAASTSAAPVGPAPMPPHAMMRA